jgi:colanic acid biosynthesis glycosyl transferase WcaI
MKTGMKFLIITQYFPPEVGAAQTRLAATSAALQEHGHSVEVVTAMPNYPKGVIDDNYKGPFYLKEEYKGATVHRFWLMASLGKAWGRLAAYLSLMITALFGLSRVQKPDVVFVNSGPLFMGLTGFIYAQFFRVPMIFYVADLWPRSVEHLEGLGAARILLKMALFLEAWVYHQSLYVVAVTEGVRDILIHEKKLPVDKVLFLPNGVDVEIFHPRPVKEELVEKYQLQGKKAFIYAGNHGFAHALDTVVEAADLLRSHPEVLILLVGGGSEKPRLQRLTESKGLENIIFVDPVDPAILADYIQMSYMGLIHIRNSPLALETRPAKMFPLMAMGKAILYAGHGEGGRLLTDCGGGWVIEPENPMTLKDKILELCAQPAEVERRGQKNLLFVKQNMSFSKLVGDWLKTVRIP